MIEDDPNPSKAYVIISGKLAIVKKNKIETTPHNTNNDRAQFKLKSLTSVMEIMQNSKKTPVSSLRQNLFKNNACLSLTTTNVDEFTFSMNEPTLQLIEQEYQDSSFDRRISRIMQKFGHLLDIAQSGEIIGDVALITDHPRSATVIAVEDSHLMVFNRDSLQSVRSTYTLEFMDRKALLRSVFPSIAMLLDGEKLNNIARMFKPVSHTLVFLLLLELLFDQRRRQGQESLRG